MHGTSNVSGLSSLSTFGGMTSNLTASPVAVRAMRLRAIESTVIDAGPGFRNLIGGVEPLAFRTRSPEEATVCFGTRIGTVTGSVWFVALIVAFAFVMPSIEVAPTVATATDVSPPAVATALIANFGVSWPAGYEAGMAASMATFSGCAPTYG